MKQPLVMVAVLYGTGIILGHFLEAPLLRSIIIAIVSAFLALVVRAWRGALVAIAVFLFGWANMSSRTAVISPWDLRTTWQERETIATIQAIVLDTPSERVSSRKGVDSSHTLAELEVTALRGRSGDWQPAFGKVMSRTSGVLPRDFQRGGSVEVSGVAMHPVGPLAPGMFDYKRHLNLRGFHYELKVDSPSDWKMLGAHGGASFANRFRAWAQRTLARGLPEEDEAVRLQWAMLLGWKTALTSEVSEPFMRSGTMHIFAISGLHIAMIAGICIALLRAAAFPQIACGLVVIPIIWFYTAATGWQASAIRSTVMMTVIIVGWALRRPTDLINSLATAACLILIWQPEQLFQSGFQLSFFVVLSIALLSPGIETMKRRIFALDPMLPDELRPRWQRIGIKAANLAWSSFAVSLAAFIGSVPLIAHYFHLFTPGSLVANLLIVPVSSLALMSGIGALATGDLIPILTEWFNHSGWFWMRAMICPGR
jgi:competence protein ComEC